MTPKERRAALRKIADAQRREDAQARRFLRAILEVAGVYGIEIDFIRQLAAESEIYWRNVKRARVQMGLVCVRGSLRPGGRAGWTSTWYLPEVAPRAGERGPEPL